MNKDIKFDFNDVLLVPDVSSDISSRSEINPYTINGTLPIYNAPMDRVISLKNEKSFKDNKINVVQTRGEISEDVTTIVSYSLNEMVDLVKNGSINENRHYLIDVANGHMKKLHEFIVEFKTLYPNTFLMVGNIANSETYRVISEAGADACRINIGSGNSCSTSLNTAVGYPVGSLIVECREIARTIVGKRAEIIADGGMRNYSDVIKALALGADKVMIGGLFNKMIESAGENYLFNIVKIPQPLAYKFYNLGLPIYKSMRGMSTQEVQKDWGKSVLRASEGLLSRNKVNGSLERWTSEFTEYLRSAMSYCGARSLEEFIGEANYTLITDNSLKRIQK